MCQPISDRECLKLQTALESDFVINTATGETYRLSGCGTLQFSEEGRAFVSTVQPQFQDWCSNFLSWQVFEGEDEDAGYRFMTTKTCDRTIWLDEAALEPSTIKALHLRTALFEKSMLAFVSEHPKGNSCLRWALPNVIDLVLGNGFDGRWISRNMKAFKDYLQKDEVVSEIVPSLWSVRFAAQPADVQRAVNNTPCDDEFNAGFDAIVSILLHLVAGAGSGRRRSLGQDHPGQL